MSDQDSEATLTFFPDAHGNTVSWISSIPATKRSDLRPPALACSLHFSLRRVHESPNRMARRSVRELRWCHESMSRVTSNRRLLSLGRRSERDVTAMTDKKTCGVRLDPDLANRLEVIKARTGLSVSEQIRRGIRLWLESREWPTPSRRLTAPHTRRGKRPRVADRE